MWAFIYGFDKRTIEDDVEFSAPYLTKDDPMFLLGQELRKKYIKRNRKKS